MGNVLDKNAVLDRVKQFYNLKGNADLARFLGVSPNTVTNWYSRKSLDIDAIYTNCVECNFHWLLTGEDLMLNTDGVPTSPSTPSIDIPVPSDTVVLRLLEKIDEKDIKIDKLQSELRAMTAELAALKASHSQSQEKEPEHPPVMDKVTETFISDSSGDYGEGYSPTKPPTTSKRSSAGKM